MPPGHRPGGPTGPIDLAAVRGSHGSPAGAVHGRHHRPLHNDTTFTAIPFDEAPGGRRRSRCARRRGGPARRIPRLGRLDGRYLSTEVAGGFTGRMVGLWCAAGELIVRSLTYRGSDAGFAKG
ncbi:MAG: beta-xylosidase family glycoside hydrolase [Acidimicrobiales bacterium]